MSYPKPTLVDEADLVVAARNHSEDAFRELFVRHSPKVFRIALRMTANEADAADAAQETFLKAWQHLDQFQGRACFSTWLHRIAVNECQMLIRRDRKVRWEPLGEVLDHKRGIQPSEITGPEDDPEQSYAREELAEIFRQAADSLPCNARQAVVLRYIDGLTNEETAALLGATIPSIKAVIHRARVGLREKLTPFQEGPRDKGRLPS